MLPVLALSGVAEPAAPLPSPPAVVQAQAPCGPRTPRPGDGPAGAGRGAAPAIAQLTWLAGTWTADSGSTVVEERWTPPAGGTMLAMARTVRDGRMVGFEFLCISERNGTLVYSAMPNGRTPATDFALRAITPDSVTFENPAHDFPTSIRYARLPDGSLETTVAGSGPGKPQRVVLTREP
jgi:hypothetical protein